MTAHVDLNPVRAGIVNDPKDHHFCGYAEVVAAVDSDQRGLERSWSAAG